MTFRDISPQVRPGIPVRPGDTAHTEERTWRLDGDCPVNVSKFTMSTHTGSHADAPVRAACGSLGA
jgi:arylformamidase